MASAFNSIFGNNAPGPQLHTNTVSVTQRVFGSDCLLGTAQLALTSSFNLLHTYKVAFTF